MKLGDPKERTEGMVGLICAGIAGLVWLYLLFGMPAGSARSVRPVAAGPQLWNANQLF